MAFERREETVRDRIRQREREVGINGANDNGGGEHDRRATRQPACSDQRRRGRRGFGRGSVVLVWGHEARKSRGFQVRSASRRRTGTAIMADDAAGGQPVFFRELSTV